MTDKTIERKTLEEREQGMIKVVGDYLIDVDSYGYNVRIKGNTTPEAYFGKMSNALEYIWEELKRARLKADARTVEDAIGIIKSTDDEFINLIKYAFPEYDIVKSLK